MLHYKHFICVVLTFAVQFSQQEDLLIILQDDELKPLIETLIPNVTSRLIVQLNTNPTQQEIDRLCSFPRPKLLLDLTTWQASSDNAKMVSKFAYLPTLTTSFGSEGDFVEWLTLSDNHKRMFLQIKQPADVIPYVVRAIVEEQKCTNAAILYDESFVMYHKLKMLLLNMEVRHSIIEYKPFAISTLRSLDIYNFFIVGTKSTIIKFFGEICIEGYHVNYAYYAVSMEEIGEVNLNCARSTAARYLLATPKLTNTNNVVSFDYLRDNSMHKLTQEFYHDIVQMALRINPSLPKSDLKTTCENGIKEDVDKKTILPYIKKILDANAETQFLLHNYHINDLWNSFIHVEMELTGYYLNDKGVHSREHVADWSYHTQALTNKANLERYKSTMIYKIAIAVQEPFVFADPNAPYGYSGFCIDLIEEIAKKVDFKYQLYRPNGTGFRYDFEGVKEEIQRKNADIALGSLSVDHSMKTSIDFTIPFYELVGMLIMMKIPESSKSIFKIIEVLDVGVWGMLFVLYFITSFLLWLYDKYSPSSYQNNKEELKDSNETREFTVRESLWFSLTSLTSQGGGEAPRPLSSKIVAGLWWLFGFLIVASYTANLAAFLTASHLEMSIESLEDLSRQYRVKYGVVNQSTGHRYFQSLKAVEDDVHTRSLAPFKGNQDFISTFQYSIDGMYSKMLMFMEDSRSMPNDLEEAIAKVQASTSTNSFAYIGDATDIKFAVMTHCDLQAVGEEFAKKFYALAVGTFSPLKEPLDNALMELLNERTLEKLRNKWWRENPKVVQCSDRTDGITIQNVVGVFLLIGGGVLVSMLILALENAYEKRQMRLATRILVKPTEPTVFNVPTNAQ